MTCRYRRYLFRCQGHFCVTAGCHTVRLSPCSSPLSSWRLAVTTLLIVHAETGTAGRPSLGSLGICTHVLDGWRFGLFFFFPPSGLRSLNVNEVLPSISCISFHGCGELRCLAPAQCVVSAQRVPLCRIMSSLCTGWGCESEFFQI